MTLLLSFSGTKNLDKVTNVDHFLLLTDDSKLDKGLDS